MNKSDKFVAALLALALIGWFGWNLYTSKQAAEAAAAEAAKNPPAQVETKQAPAPVEPAKVVEAVEKKVEPVAEKVAEEVAKLAPEQLVVLSNDLEVVTLSTHGATIKSVKLLKYAKDRGEISEKNPAVVLDFASAPALADAKTAAWTVKSADAASVTFECDGATRRVELKADYVIAVSDSKVPTSLSIGTMTIGNSKNDILSIDSWELTSGSGKVIHWGETDPLKGFLTGGIGGCGFGGCGGKPDAATVPEVNNIAIPGEQRWVAVKNRFFVTSLVKSSAKVKGFNAVMRREPGAEYKLRNVDASVSLEGEGAAEHELFIGPKQQSLLWGLGMRDVMEFGMWRWVCYPMVWVLNLFNSWIPSYGIAIILLTILVRIVFWPLTHKSTVGMRKMQEIQPKIKEIQERCKDNPQKLQQETWACYRENKVNPMSSCLPMLVQIPVFIALFTVLRSAVELRYASFLWIADLSEPENLFAGMLPFVDGLNILPILMAVTMGLQSALTPSTGDKQQQKMMMLFMPAMMLFMFYSFPSALSLYWTLSQVISIGQMWWIRKRYTPAPVASVEVVDAPVTRQMRRHGN